MLDKKYSELAKQQALYYAERIPSPSEYPTGISSRGRSAIIAYLLITPSLLIEYDNGMDYWHCEISTALRDFAQGTDWMYFPTNWPQGVVDFFGEISKDLRTAVGGKRVIQAPVRLNIRQDQMTIRQMIKQVYEETPWL